MSDFKPRNLAHLTVKMLADRWGTSPHAIHVKRWRGDAPVAIKVGARVLFTLADVEAFEASRVSANTTSPSSPSLPAEESEDEQ